MHEDRLRPASPDPDGSIENAPTMDAVAPPLRARQMRASNGPYLILALPKLGGMVTLAGADYLLWSLAWFFGGHVKLAATFEGTFDDLK